MDFEKFISTKQIEMVNTLLEQGQSVSGEHEFHIEGLLDRVTPRIWAKDNYGIEKGEFVRAIAWGALKSYSESDVASYDDPDRLIAVINSSYQMLNLMGVSKEKYPGDKVAHEIAIEFNDVAPCYSSWLSKASQKWIELMEEFNKEAITLVEMTRNALRD